jgi:hypothetical protein
MPECTKQNSLAGIHPRVVSSAEEVHARNGATPSLAQSLCRALQPSSTMLVLCNLHAKAIILFLCFLDVTSRGLTGMACSPGRTLKHSLCTASHMPPWAATSCQVRRSHASAHGRSLHQWCKSPTSSIHIHQSRTLFSNSLEFWRDYKVGSLAPDAVTLLDPCMHGRSSQGKRSWHVGHTRSGQVSEGVMPCQLAQTRLAMAPGC